VGARRGLLLVNLGTPEAPRPREVRRYLREFLGDPYVLDMSAWARRLLLELVILPTRPRRTAAAYAKIWSAQGSPLLVHSLALRDAVADALGPDHVVELGMRYGQPSLAAAVARLCEARPESICVLPLFPQYSTAATASALARVAELLPPNAPPVRSVRDFYAQPGYVAAVADAARPELEEFAPDHVLFSFHGLPERQVKATDPSAAHCLASASCCDAIGEHNGACYRAQCAATTRAVVAALGLAPERTSLAFQSRLGRAPWITPHTDVVIPQLAERGVRRLAVLCPSFVADCLETLEEIGIRAREQWREVGGEALHLVPCVNRHPTWVAAVAQLAEGASGEGATPGPRLRR
jgi:ferrochelatase